MEHLMFGEYRDLHCVLRFWRQPHFANLTEALHEQHMQRSPFEAYDWPIPLPYLHTKMTISVKHPSPTSLQVGCV